MKLGPMQSVVFVDPGKHAIALAHWVGPTYQRAELVEGPRINMHDRVRELRPDLLVVEVPVSYQLGKQKGDQNDLIAVALSAGAAMAACERVRQVAPGEWKGQVPKEIHHRRIRSEMTQGMLYDVNRVPSGLQHNVLDAIALGLWWFKLNPT